MRVQTKLYKLLLAGIFVAFTAGSLFAQDETEAEPAGEDESGDESKSRFNKWSAAFHFGHAVPYTDIRQYDYYPVFKYKNENRYGLGASLNYNLNNAIMLQARFIYASLQGVRRGAQVPPGSGNYAGGVYFNTSVLNYGLNVVFNVTNVSFAPKGAGKQRKVGAYIFLGHGLVAFRAQAYKLLSDKPLIDYKAGHSGYKDEKTKELIWVYEANNPFGFGLKYKISKKIDLGLEINMNRVNSDKLDGFVTGSSGDYWWYSCLMVTYKFGKAGEGAEHIDWINPIEVMYADIQANRERIDELTKDKDNDGVADMFDKDSNTPEGVKVDGGGVSLDSDRDGVADTDDEDPFTDIGATVDERGKAIDSDGDGVPDNRDLEANTEKGALVNFQGTTITAKGKKVGTTTIGGDAAFFPSVYFNLNSSGVKYANYDRLATIARALKSNEGLSLTLTGHTDKTGPEEYNMKLGERRAQAVKDHLVKHYGIDGARLSVESKGETESLAEGLSHVNRRVDATPQ